MNVKEAVARAKQYVFELFSDESPANIRLEEVEFDEKANEWLVTIGFSRPWDNPAKSPLTAFTNPEVPPLPARRAYKVVRISNDKDDVISVKSREIKV
ncbi:hypothetical protein IQ254_27575 [Nodosilinea sp. LEGE 07088]|uniref:hypothetical protein n=1 Tax=Nodosilinea sp. LEGE 07088 TaxID=2777968 RepID=UPI00187E244B|nr:hypothetical protein [Nodosilinea sp. LEGE 07088]MBE9140915.1 hypothetical protein [Nodosilinea sp. LEGE 07088]